jgi:glycosyltransferase involved in cell wall biosynthesis
MPNFTRTLLACTGQYIAVCEGDDYWISPHKLQKQARILEQDPTVALVFHNAWTKHEESRRDYFLNQGIDKSRFSLDEIVERDWFMATASIVFRRNPPLPPEITRYSIVGDMLIQLAACRTGDAVYLDEVSSVYRRHEGGVSEELWKCGDSHYEKFRPNNIWMYWLLRERVFSVSCHEAVERRIRNIVDKILGYAVLRKGMSRDYRALEKYLWQVVRENRPEFLGDDVVKKDGPLWCVMDSQLRAFWKQHRRRQVRNAVTRFVGGLVPEA